MDTRSRHLLKVGMIANIFEWYEFTIFVSLGHFIAKLFFKADEPIIELIRMYSVFALSFIARPLGGILFGLIGDRISRRDALRLSLTLMSIPTVLIGILPTYDQVGIIATISLLVLRLIQGFAAGGELPMTACYVFESSSNENRSLLCSMVATSPKIGMLSASLVSFLLMTFISEQTILNGAWRIPFLLGIPLTGFIIYLRSAIKEPVRPSLTPQPHTSLSDVRRFVPNIIKAMSLVAFGALFFYTLLIWMPTYLTHFLSVPPVTAHFTTTITLCAILPLYLFVHYLSNYFGSKKLVLLSVSLIMLAVVPSFQILQSYSDWRIILAIQLILGMLYVAFDGILIETLGNLFPPIHRSIGFGTAWTIAAALVGGTTPLVCTYIIHRTGWLIFPALYIILFGSLALMSAWSLSESSPTTESNQT